MPSKSTSDQQNQKVVDLFAGAGGLSIGFSKAGYDVIASYDNWEIAIRNYSDNFPKVRTVQIDIRKMMNKSHDEIEFLMNASPTIIIGGPPCQDFSQAGKRNENGENGDLTPVYARIVSVIRPKWFVMENVNTILSIGRERLGESIEILHESGYGLTMKVLNAADYGVPQDRKRLFLIGRLHGKNDEMIRLLEEQRKKRITVRKYLPEIAEGKSGIEYYYRHPWTYERRAIFSIDEISPTIRGVNRPIPPTYRFHRGDRTKDLSKVRPLTTLERSRVQTFPANYRWTGTKTQKEQLIGNAVPPELAYSIATAIKRFGDTGLRRFINFS